MVQSDFNTLLRSITVLLQMIAIQNGFIVHYGFLVDQIGLYGLKRLVYFITVHYGFVSDDCGSERLFSSLRFF